MNLSDVFSVLNEELNEAGIFKSVDKSKMSKDEIIKRATGGKLKIGDKVYSKMDSRMKMGNPHLWEIEDVKIVKQYGANRTFIRIKKGKEKFSIPFNMFTYKPGEDEFVGWAKWGD